MYLQEFSDTDIYKNILKTYPKFHFRIYQGDIYINNTPISDYSLYNLKIPNQ